MRSRTNLGPWPWDAELEGINDHLRCFSEFTDGKVESRKLKWCGVLHEGKSKRFGNKQLTSSPLEDRGESGAFQEEVLTCVQLGTRSSPGPKQKAKFSAHLGFIYFVFSKKGYFFINWNKTKNHFWFLLLLVTSMNVLSYQISYS